MPNIQFKDKDQLINHDNKLDNIITIENVESFNMENTIISINGANNIIHIEDNVKLKNTKITIEGDNNVVYLSSSIHTYYINVTVYNNSVFYIGKNNFINGILNCVLAEEKNIIIGKDNMFSFEVWLRVADSHLIYSTDSHRRINHSKSVYIGDHVWIGQHAMILKGARIGSGSIVGALAVTSSLVPSNVIVTGNPGKISKTNIFWDGSCVHKWKASDTEKYEIKEEETNVYSGNSDFFDIIENGFKGKNSLEKCNYIIDQLVKKQDKNRFSVDIEK